jgi:hypothetical protein
MVSDDSSTSESMLSRHFPTFKRVLDGKGSRRIVRWRGEVWAFRALKKLEAELAEDAAQGNHGDRQRRLRILSHRGDFRRIIGEAHPAVMKLYLSKCPAEMAPLAVWLWGRCADRFRLHGLAAYCFDPSTQVRRRVAKALRRLEAWSYLRLMAAAYPDDAKIQWYATAPTTRRSFAGRLKNFTSGVDDSHADEVATPSQMPFWALESFWSYTPPKSVVMIRRMLRRIQHWVRWGVS